jgi:hypothetical protein
MAGKKIWWIPDGDLPEPITGDQFISHESLMVLNPNDQPAQLVLTFYWVDHAPDSLSGIVVDPERVRCIRIDHLEAEGIRIPYRTQYALKVESDTGIFVQYGRLDTAQPNFALVGIMGISE